ncbi:periplasmic heavy metal sensor [Oceanibium sediminis]|uniref:periplasmic heavy metal sensor n=1 Tax=Oceanibium sediminis TaxID=2026339 RepID=UPI000DD3E881|nr:periplasmic heavy metal sensor [Oceanibium sediminis]
MSAPDAPRLPRWAKLLLVLSLALNLAVAGVVAGHLLRGAPPSGDRAFNLPIDGFRNISRAMPAAEREALRNAWHGHRAEIRAARTDLRNSRAAFLQALRAEPFSAEAVERILSAQADRWQSFSAVSREILVARIAEMPPEARRAFADRLEESLSRRRADGGPHPSRSASD